MQLDQAFRKTLEMVGLEKISHKCFWNTVKDMCQVTNASSFIWSVLIDRGIISAFEGLKNCDADISHFISQVCYNTGLDNAKVEELLSSLRYGLTTAFYGANPQNNSNNTLMYIYERNKELWIQREHELKDGIIIAQKDRRYGVLSITGEILPFKYLGATKFYHGIGCFNDGLNTGFINIMGNMEIDINRLSIDGVTSIGPFENGVAKLHGLNRKIGYLSINGNRTECIYDDISSSQWHGPLVEISKDGLKGLMNNNCQIIVQPQFTFFTNSNKSTKFLLGKDETNGWHIIKYNGEIIKASFNSPKIINEALIQDIRINAGEAIYEYYNSDKNKIIAYPIDAVICTHLTPMLIHGQNGLYYYVTTHGLTNNQGFEKAFPFFSDFSWIKVGNKWFRINKAGNKVLCMDNVVILSGELNGRVLGRNLNTSLIEVINANTGISLITIPNSYNSVVKLAWSYGIYEFSAGQINYCWTNGKIISTDKAFDYYFLDEIYHNANELAIIRNIDDLTFELFLNGEPTGIFRKKNKEDEIASIETMDNGSRIIIYYTKEYNSYFCNISLHKYSDEFADIGEVSRVKAIIVSNGDSNSYLIDSSFNIIAQYETIRPTSCNDYFKIISNHKVGLISYEGAIVIAPEYDSLSYYKSIT